jgi:flagellin
MASFINTNVASLQAQNNLANSQGGLTTALQRLSSGLKINSAADDAAGFAISQRMTAQINGLNQAAENANDGISLAQTAGGALTSVEANLQTLRQLAVESANATNTTSDRQALNAEAQQLVSSIQNTAQTTQFNGQNLLNGSFQAQQFQVGANADQTVSVSVQGATTNTLGNFGGASLTTVGTVGWTTAATIAINGVNIGASNATTAAGVTAGSAYAKAAAINAQTSLTGVTATAFTTTSSTLGAVSTNNTVTSAVVPTTAVTGASTASGQLWINGIAIGAISSSSSELGQIQNAANAINAVASQSGVTASADASTGTLVLSAQDGRNIQIATTSVAVAAGSVGAGSAAGSGTSAFSNVFAATGLTADTFSYVSSDATDTTGSGINTNGNLDTNDTFGTTTGLFTGALTLNSSASINITDTVAATTTELSSGGLSGYSSQLSSLATLDISTVTGANAAINIVDAAINQINAQQADLGAVQNSFTGTISNLQTSSTNLSAAQSRIEDTDYASETANLAHYQILQQAGTAMLAQANALPNSILTLLR